MSAAYESDMWGTGFGNVWKFKCLPLVPGVDNMNTGVPECESLNGVAEPRPDLLEIEVFDGTKSVRAKKLCHASRLETADRTFISFLELFGPLRF